jgi:SpoVK/Ycf46/Vps4 family AAA+-type ATPase
MDPIKKVIAEKRQSDRELWGVRPVIWGLRMLGADARRMVECLTPGERREASDFLGIDLPAISEGGSDAQGLDALVAERQKAINRKRGKKSVLDKNLGLLRDTLQLSELEINLIAFRAMLRLHGGFEALAGKYVGFCADFVFHRKLGCLFDVPDNAIELALARSGRLVRHGLVEPSRGAVPLVHRLRLLPGIINALVSPAESTNDLFLRLLPSQREARLQISDYPHLAAEIGLIRSQLDSALASQTRGTNVLLYGKPGTGKSELAATLAASLQSRLYVLQSMDDDDDSRTPRVRLRELAQLQRLLQISGRSLVLVDEAEDLFPTIWSDSDKVPTKSAVNECLEHNPTPTIWISNRTEHMDEAFLRRFDLVAQVPPLPSRLRRDLLRKALPPQTLQEDDLRRFSERRELTPAVLARMTRVAMAGDKDEPAVIRANLHTLTDQYLCTVGAPPLNPTASVQLQHDPVLLNTDPPMDSLLGAIGHGGLGARMLLHGDPGTGKTALGKALAERLDRPLLQRQASSLLSPYVGGTERNLRDMFNEARRENGILLLDEADSFLSSRDYAHARWEVTQTNEFLTQIENFEGILICTTNRLDDLDPAALRRFDFKVAFKPLRPCQRVKLVRQCCARLGIDADINDAALAERVQALDGCTPGDAAAVLRRLAVTGIAPTLETLMSALVEECRYKPAAHTPIGFLH